MCSSDLEYAAQTATYHSLKTGPRQQRQGRKARLQELEAELASAVHFLETEFDGLIYQWRESAPEFFGAYHAARAIGKPRVVASKPGIEGEGQNPNPTPKPGSGQTAASNTIPLQTLPQPLPKAA